MQLPPSGHNAPPTAQGTFAKTPLPHLLVYALERGLSGSFQLMFGGHAAATALFTQGFPAKVRLADGVHFLGDVLCELGLLGPAELERALAARAESPRLLGEILLELGLVDGASLELGLRAQVERKLEHLFTLPAETEYAYYDALDLLSDYGGAPNAIDPLATLWRGVRKAPAWEHVDATLKRIDPAAVRLKPTAQVERFGFSDVEMDAIDLLRQRPLRVADLAHTQVLGPSAAQLLVYCLVITKQTELVDASEFGASQAFARLQLQARPVQKSPLIAAEPVLRSTSDGRIASPMPQAILVGGASPGGDIASLISSTIDAPPSAAPSTAAAAKPPSASPFPAGSATAAAAAQPAPAAPLTNEQSALKAKILERARQIASQNYFQMLGVPQDAAPEAVEKAFIGLAKVWHPDRLPAALHDVREACSKVFTHITEAHATLSDPARRADYMTLLKEGGATPEDQAKIQAVIEAATEFQKAEILFKRNDLAKAYELVKRAYELDPEQADYLAMIAWLEAQQPAGTTREKTLEKIAVLDECIRRNPRSERAYFWRGLLYKRIDETTKSIRDFKQAAELNPRNLDAIREVRLHTLRGGTASKPPPPPSQRPGAKPPPAPETLGGLFGKLFKK